MKDNHPPKVPTINKLADWAYWIAFLSLPVAAIAGTCGTINLGIDTYQRIKKLIKSK